MEELVERDNRVRPDDVAADDLDRIEQDLHAQRRIYRRGAGVDVPPPVPPNGGADESSSSSSSSASDGLPDADPPVIIRIGGNGGAAGALDPVDDHCISPEMARVRAELEPIQRECFACDMDNPESSAICYEHWRRMERLMQSKLNTTNTIRLAKQLGIFFELHVRKPANARLLEGETPIPPWNSGTIYMHIRYHINDTGIRRHGHLEDVQMAIQQFQTYELYKWVVRDGERVRVPDRTQWPLYERMVRLYKHVSDQDPRKAGFSWSGIGTPSDDSLPIGNRKRAYLGNTARFNGTSHAARAAAGLGGSTVQGSGAKRGKQV
jgi:hypothetical protein